MLPLLLDFRQVDLALSKDVRDHVAVEQAVAAIHNKFGRIDVLLCSAGVADNIKAEGKSRGFLAIDTYLHGDRPYVEYPADRKSPPLYHFPKRA